MKNEDSTRKVIKLIFHTVTDEVIDSDYFWLSEEPNEAKTRAMIHRHEGCKYVDAYTFWVDDADDFSFNGWMKYVWRQDI